MCVNCKWIKNRYTGEMVLSKCGKCNACIQEKANKMTSRIKLNSSPGTNCLFVSLTYENRFVPYIWSHDLACRYPFVHIYRDRQVRYVRRSHDYKVYRKVYYKPHILTTVELDYHSFPCPNKVPELKNYQERVGVCYFKDVQDFIKRLRINLDRNYGYKDKIGFFATTEYGSTTYRPHVHLLLYFTKGYETQIKQAVIKSWPFANLRRFKRSIEFAIDPAAYVASYVNKPSDFSPLFKNRGLKQKHSYSHGFGMGLSDFQLPKILEKIHRGDLSYVRSIGQKGNRSDVVLPIPKYVINRFFPKPKGYSRFTPAQVAEYLYDPQRTIKNFISSDFINHRFVVEDVHNITISLLNARERYKAITGNSDFQYVRDFISAWSVYQCTCERLLHADIKCVETYSQFYDNNDFYIACPDIAPTLRVVTLPFVTDVNKMAFRIAETIRLESIFQEKLKQHQVTDICASAP